MPSSRILDRSTAITILLAAIGAGLFLRIFIGLSDHGIYWPDEIYQSLEPAHRLVYGYGMVAWEFIEGARNWALPGLIAGLLALARLVGLDDPAGYLAFIRIFFALVAVGTAWGVYRLARTYDANPIAAAGAAAVFALAAPIVYFGHRAMSETASALPVVMGFAFALTPSAKRWQLWLGASLLGIAVLLRLQNGVFCVGLLGILAGRRQWRATGEVFAVLLVWAFLFGLLDKLTWGGWFHSAGVYLRFNLIEGKAAAWGVSPPDYYARVLWRSMPIVTALLTVGAVLAVPRAAGLVVTAVAFFALHSWTPHKEFRFLLPALPIFCALAAVGFTWLGERVADRRIAVATGVALAAAAGLSAVRYQKLTFGDLGAYENAKPKQSAWRDFDDVNKLLIAAHDAPDLCGLKNEIVHLAWTGGHTYLHREVPIYPHNGPPRSSRRYNYVITWTANPPGRIVVQEGRVALVQIHPDCAPDPAYSWKLP